MAAKQELALAQREALLGTLKERFMQNIARHQGITWEEAQAKLKQNTGKLWALHQMEETGGEPDVVYPAPGAPGGALFCDRRYNHVFTYHNGAESYYGVRGFRGMLAL